MKDFKTIIKENNFSKLSRIKKIDIHNHAACSCTKEWLTKNNINMPKDKITDIYSLNEFCKNYINPIHYTKKGIETLLKGNFDNCVKTGVSVVAPSIDYKICIKVFDNNINEFLSFLKGFKYDKLMILWDLGISRDTYEDNHFNMIIDLLKSKFFCGIDLYGVEDPSSNYKFKKYYKLANKLGIITKVHAGEQLGADYIKQCIKDFKPKQIQHGINIIYDVKVMKLAKKKNIIFNICPTSNIVLGYAKSLEEHPIKRMVEYGLNVTIGTDDILFFESNINNEYIKLYNANTLSLKQLDNIRKYGLNLVSNYCNNKK